MKNNIRKTILFVSILFLIMLSCINNVSADTNKLIYMDINSVQALEIGEIEFSNIVFKDYSNTSTKAFGLTGKIVNSSGSNTKYKVEVTYYDSNYYLVAKETSYGNILNGVNSFIQMSNLNILQDKSVSDIRYYTLIITVDDNINIGGLTNEYIMTPSKNYEYNNKDYVIDKYDINIVVNENNKLDITETITAYFNVPKHGIIRTLPLKNNITRLDGTSAENRTQVTNVKVDNEYTTSKDNGDYKIKIGSANYTITGEQTYVIKYTYNLGEDKSKEYDEIYYNIIGTEWDTAIGNVTFSVTMPKEFDASKLGFSAGYMGSTSNANIIYNANGNKITGSVNRILERGEALTIRCELPEGYFVGAGLELNKRDMFMFASPVILLIIVIVIWYKNGRDDMVVETVEFYPPDNMNSLDIGFWYKGKADNKDVTSLLIYLANKGYIQIVDETIGSDSQKIKLSDEERKKSDEKILELKNKIFEEKLNDPNSKKIKYYQNMLNIYENIDEPIDYDEYGVKDSVKDHNVKKDFVIRKLKDYDGTDKNEQYFLEGLFRKGKTEVTEKQLTKKFYTTTNKILRNKNNKENTEKIFEKGSTNKNWFIIFSMIITYILITIPTVLTYGVEETLFFDLLFTGIGFSVLFGMLFGGKDLFTKLFGLFWGGMFGGLPWIFMILPALQQDYIYMLGYIIGIIAIILMAIFKKYMPKRTPEGTKMLGKIRGFKKFLETAEKERLEALVMKNPNYFYDILPYTYVLRVSDKWIKKFETINIEEPEWYNSIDSFDYTRFSRFVDTTVISAQRVMSSRPSYSSSGGSSGGFSSSSGGSSSGGGSSGGGSGGGGGSSW